MYKIESNKDRYVFNTYKKNNMILLYNFIVIGTIVQIFIPNSIVLSIICFMILNILCFYSIEFDITHPFVWFVPSFTMYSIAFPILYMMGETKHNYTNKTMLLQWIAICTFVICMKNNQVIYNTKKLIDNKSLTIIKLIYITFLILILMQAGLIVSMGLTSKISIAQSNNIIISLGSIAGEALVIPAVILYLQSIKEHRIDKKYFIVGLLVITISSLATGERSLLLKYIVIFLLIYNVTVRKIDIRKFIIIGIVGLFLITAMAPLKMVLTRGITKSEDKIIVQILNSDFSSAGLNLNNLLIKQDLWEYKFGSTLIHDFIRPIDFIIPIDISHLSALAWNQNTFWPGKITGMGFTLVGEGYINFGVLGVIIWYIFIANFIKIFYYNSYNNQNSFILYLLLITIMIYSNRADLANVFSPFLRYGIIFIAMLNLLSKRYRIKL